MTGPQDVRSDSVAKYDPSECERLIAQLRLVLRLYHHHLWAEHMDVLRFAADQLAAARAEIERLRSADIETVRAVVKRAVLHIERTAVTAVRIERIDQIINEAIDAYRAARDKAGG